jgi:DNA-binding protein H-NS
MKSIKSMNLEELLKTKMQIELTVHSLIQRELGRAVKQAAATTKPNNGLHGSNGSKQKHALKGRRLPIKFRNPKNRKETWAGRGLKPRWLVAALKGGKRRLDDFAVG